MQTLNLSKDEKVWTYDGEEMIGIELTRPNSRCLEILVQWLDKNTEGEYVITPHRIFFEHAAEATLFKLKFV